MNILDQIVEVKKEEVKKLRNEFSLSRFQESEFFETQTIEFKNALNNSSKISIIAEVKKASPSKGIIRKDFNHTAIAEQYMEFGADAVSVLTDQNFFKGNISYLKDIAGFKTVPLLRKDFIIDEYQVYEAKANGADAILLICEILSASQINELTHCAKELGIASLLELHSEEQMSKINFSENEIIGINNRDLENFNTDLNTTSQIGKLLPENIVLVAESGISEKQHLELLKKTNTKAILVGEHLMRSGSIADSLKHLTDWCRRES